MKTLFLLLSLLTDGNQLRSLFDACFTTGVASVLALSLFGFYHAIRRAYPRRNSGAASRA